MRRTKARVVGCFDVAVFVGTWHLRQAKSLPHYSADEGKARPDVLGHDSPEQRVRRDIINRQWDNLPDKPRIALEDDDPVTVRAAHELNEVALVLAAVLRPVARAFYEHLHTLAKQQLVVLLA